ncbi:SDR family oxidoreductase [Candidatus Woesearchaeota archaeon]|nr:SDR family oxidoreductase [Candidatus Woesearchaeota archaeon]
MVKQAVLITGASSGIGLELAKLFAKRGFNLVLVSSNAQKLDDAKKLLGSCQGIVITIPKDLAIPGAARQLYQQVRNAGFSIDVLVNNAGFGIYGEFATQSLERNTELIHLNCTTLTQLTHLFLPEMLKNKTGKILNVASVAGFFPGYLMASYYASKAYVLSFSQALGEELRGTGVSVTTLCPGATATNFEKTAGAQTSRLFKGHIMTAQQVAQEGYRGLMKNKKLIIPGLKNKFLVFIARFLPRGIVVKKIQGKR